MTEEPGKDLTLQQLPELRRKTEAVSRFLQRQIEVHLETLRPLFAPDRILGKLAGGKVEVLGAERAMVELQQNYKPFTRKPYDLPETLDPHWLTLVGSTLVLHPWEYPHPAQGKTIVMSSPVCWVLSYRSNYSLAEVKAALGGNTAARPEYVRQFVVNALVLQLALNHNPGLAQLFQDLRYELKVEPSVELKGLPVVTITSSLKSFRPSDDLIAAATAFSGVPAFIELLDIEAFHRVPDPMQARIEALLV